MMICSYTEIEENKNNIIIQQIQSIVYRNIFISSILNFLWTVVVFTIQSHEKYSAY